MKDNKKGKNIFLKLIFFVNCVIFIACLVYIGMYIYEGYKSESGVDDLRKKRKQIESNINDNVNGKNGDYTDSDMLEVYKEMRADEYPDVVGYIKIDDTPVDYYVMQTIDDPEYYLYRDVKGNYNKEGTPFVDATSDLYKPSYNIMIYSHAMLNNHKFGILKKYSEKDYYNKHKYIELETMFEKSSKYEIIATFYTEIYDKNVDKFKYYEYTNIDNEKDFDEYVKNIKEIACYDTGITAKYGDRLITLSTCNEEKGKKDGRFVVVAKKIQENN